MIKNVINNDKMIYDYIAQQIRNVICIQEHPKAKRFPNYSFSLFYSIMYLI